MKCKLGVGKENGENFLVLEREDKHINVYELQMEQEKDKCV